MNKKLLTTSVFLATSIAMAFEPWIGFDTPTSYYVNTGLDNGTNTAGYWIVKADDGDGGESKVVWPVAIGNEFSATSLDPVIDFCKGVCGTADLDKGMLTYQPFVSVGFNVVGEDAKTGEPAPGDAFSWGGICITYRSDAAPSLELSLGDYDAVIGYALPAISLDKSINGESYKKCIPWSYFKQPSWYRGTKISGTEAAAQLVSINFKMQGSPGQYKFNICAIGPYGDGTGNSLPETCPNPLKPLTHPEISVSAKWSKGDDGYDATITVKDGEKELTLGTDYEIESNVNDATGIVIKTITGKGDYAGSVVKSLVPYIDENGEPQVMYDATVLTNNKDGVTELSGGKYVAMGKVSMAGIKFNGEAHLILADDATIEIETGDEYGIYASNNLTIYGQNEQSGILNATGNNDGIYGVDEIKISGGNVTATSTNGVGIYSDNGVTISGGSVTASGNSSGINTNAGHITLGWTNSTDFIKASSYYSKAGSVQIAEGKYFTDENGRVYSGTLSDNQIAAISHQTIEPLPWKNLGDYAAVQIFEDENGKKHAVIDGEYEGTETVDIPNEIAVDAVDYIRNFDANTPSTVLMPVRLPSCATVNAKFYKLDEVYQSGYRWVAKVQNIGKALPQANTAYAVLLPTAGKLEFNFEGCATAEEKQAIVQTGEIQTSGNTDGSWYFTGTYAFKRWTETENKDEVGLVYGFAGSNEKGIAKGQFGRVDFGAHANPLRCYLRKKDDSVVLKAQTLAKAAPQMLRAASYSVSLLPETIDVEFVDEDENGEHTTAIGRMDTRTGKIRLLRTDRTYDLKGRRVNDVKRAAKGAYYGKKF